MQSAVPRYLFLVLGLSLLFKLALFLLVATYHPAGAWDPDSYEYHQLALNLINHGVFSRAAAAPLDPEIIRTPGYPAFLALVYLIGGTRPAWVIVFQIALSFATIYLTYRIAALLFSEQAGFLAAALLAVDPVSVFYSQVLLTETLFNFCLTVSLLFFLQGVREAKGGAHYIAGSVLLAMATYTRPISYYLGVLIPLVLLAYWLRAGDRKQAVQACVFVLMVQVICLGGWQVRNYSLTGSAQFSHIQGEHLFYSRAAGIVAMAEGISFDEAQPRIAARYAASPPPEASRWTPAQLAQQRASVALDIIKEHPILYLWSAVKGCAALLVGPSNAAHLFGIDNVRLRTAFLQLDFSGFSPAVWLAVIPAWAYGLCFLAALYAGVVRYALRERITFEVLFLLLIAAYVVVISSGPEAYSRFRMPIMPILCVLSAAGYIRARRGMSLRAES